MRLRHSEHRNLLNLSSHCACYGCDAHKQQHYCRSSGNQVCSIALGLNAAIELAHLHGVNQWWVLILHIWFITSILLLPSSPPEGFRRDNFRAYLLLLPNSFKRFRAGCFYIHELSCCRIPFHPKARFGILNLRAAFHRAFSGIVASGFVCCHCFCTLLS